MSPAGGTIAGIPTIVLGFFAVNFLAPQVLIPILGKQNIGTFSALSGGIIVGLIYWLVGRGMLNLNGFALGLGVFVSGLAVIGNLALLFSNDANYTGVWTSLVLNGIVLIACLSGFSARSRERLP